MAPTSTPEGSERRQLLELRDHPGYTILLAEYRRLRELCVDTALNHKLPEKDLRIAQGGASAWDHAILLLDELLRRAARQS